jgi:putative addiction module component (TIGR02574 family)
MLPNEIAAEINKLSLPQKLILAQDIWDSIALEGNNLPMPEWQKKELEKRYGQYQQDQVELHDWRRIHNELRERRYLEKADATHWSVRNGNKR